jgi:hypothetical protein
VNEESTKLPAAAETTTFGLERGILPASAISGIDVAAGIPDRAGEHEVNFHVAKYALASPKMRAKGECYAVAMKFIQGQSKHHGELTPAYRHAAVMARLKWTQIRDLWKRVQRFDDGVWAAVLTPFRSKRKSVVDCYPEIAEFAAGVILERRNHISDAAVWTVVQAKFGLEDRCRESVERWCRRFRTKHRAKIIIATHPDRARSLFMPAYG